MGKSKNSYPILATSRLAQTSLRCGYPRLLCINHPKIRIHHYHLYLSSDLDGSDRKTSLEDNHQHLRWDDGSTLFNLCPIS